MKPRHLPLLALSLLFLSSARAVPTYYSAFLDGPSEAPANASPGTGSALVSYDPATHLLTVSASFANLLGLSTNAHIHGPTTLPLTGTAGVITQTPTFVGFPAGVTSGTYNHTLDLSLASSFNPSFVTAQGGLLAAETVFVDALAQGKTYFNIHSTQFGGGEIRGFLVSVPDNASTAILLLLTLPAVLGWRQRNRTP